MSKNKIKLNQLYFVYLMLMEGGTYLNLTRLVFLSVAIIKSLLLFFRAAVGYQFQMDSSGHLSFRLH